ncbi:MAG TPA: ribosome biogenesis GTPase Der [Longimicrobiales bacterium]|nr:ribosome biogenesis GTPase Der [Longimicrobiales bacterium]
MRHPLPTVAVVGRPNVGKSTFFNRVLGQRLAIVQDQPGVTRDRHFAEAEWAGHHFYLVDTGGLVTDDKEPMLAAIREQVMVAIQEADVLVFVVDGKVGPHPMDLSIAEVLRKAGRPVVLVVNKMDRLPEETAHNEFWSLGLGEPLPVSAVSGKGSGDLLDAIVGELPPPVEAEAPDDTVHVAVIGKPNVGKSSFINRLLNEERLVVSPIAGTTRDAIDTPLRYHGRRLVFIDTAGLRRQARLKEDLEFYSTLRTERAIERADVCVLLVDATEEISVQDLKVAEKAWDMGRGLIIVANKWDLVEAKETNSAVAYERHIHERAPQLRWVPVLFTSALTGQRVQKALELILQVDAERKRRISTGEVNEVLEQLAQRQQPPHVQGRPVKFYYGTQAEIEPPIFVVFTNQPKGVTESYTRYLLNGFRARWGFIGTPVWLRFRGRREER